MHRSDRAGNVVGGRLVGTERGEYSRARDLGPDLTHRQLVEHLGGFERTLEREQSGPFAERCRAAAADVAELRSGPDAEWRAVLSAYTVFRQPSYAYNRNDFKVTHPAVSEPLVRKARRLALDRQELVDKVEHGVGIVQDCAMLESAP